MENEFDYMNQAENTPEQPSAPQPEEPAPYQPESPYGSNPYSYTYTPPTSQTPPVTPTPEPWQNPPKEPENKRPGKGALIAISIIAGVVLFFNVVLLLANASLNSSVNEQIIKNEELEERIDSLEKNKAPQSSQNNQTTTPSNPGTTTPSNPGTTTPSTPTTPTQPADPSGLLTPQQVYAMNVQAVVAVTSESVTTNFYGQTSKTASIGSGFIISDDGYVVTNYHVIEGGDQFSVITSDEQEHPATVVGYDKTNDVAVLKLEGTGFHYVTLGNSDTLMVGDQVMAIGNPLGELTSTLTVGYVSAKDRMVSTDGSAINMLQTDAAINSGNSGGPLFNASGEVIGINTAKYSGTSSSGATIEGIGFAIPITDVIGIIQDLQDKGYVTSTYLGVTVREVENSAQSYGLPAGVYVEEVASGYCAEKAGVQAKDIIIALGDYEIDSLSALSRALRRFEPGQQTTIKVYRSGQELTLDITLDEKPQEQQSSGNDSQNGQNGNSGGSAPDIWDFFFGS